MTKRDTRLQEQNEAIQAELLGVAVRLARRLRELDPAAALEAAQEVQDVRRGLAESTLLGAGVSARVLGLVEDALRSDS